MRQLRLPVVFICFALALFISCAKEKQNEYQGRTLRDFSEQEAESGVSLFVQRCSYCHPDGGNAFNPTKTLHKKELEANGIKSASDIINVMRHPGPGMPRFGKLTVSDEEARHIANYILKAFS